MRTLFVGALMLLLSLPVDAQAVASTAGGYQPLSVSANPSAQEFTKLFTETGEGLHGPFMVLRKFGSMGDATFPRFRHSFSICQS
jgi:hypothetical protein